MTGDITSRVFALRARGLTQQEIADATGVSRSTVSRILAAGEPAEAGPGPRAEEVEAIARALGSVDEATRARLGLARSLAAKMDQTLDQRTAASAVAMANLARQYRDSLDELKPMASDDMAVLVAALRGDPDEHAAVAARYRTALEVIASGRSDGSRDYSRPRLSAEEAQALAHRTLSLGEAS